ncbi:hypothetical protein DICPUDRAFT_85627 [Dictyostelium purpureum]|uniref:DDE Tnp4 domain-containing protein n=1 Tax=Dictyostelium purpureum TaxID=5786 RepID=F1A6C0_DICPU|nr:uncharacterized protein DICPUDRAFT_85627 [Dictyostelium purpureum]EGC28261.1 hypothetical protein DICPUDRAFT_85627 [Dictyostelium purpureum]|eukprot:XP_003295214.1 hypothetical protein DICPUDRAFT_85627 [Dictyostelium purpureum]
MDYQVFGDDLNDQDDINDSSDEENLYDTSRFDPNEPFSFIVENQIQTEFLDSDNENDSNFNKKIDNILFNLYEETFKIGENEDYFRLDVGEPNLSSEVLVDREMNIYYVSIAKGNIHDSTFAFLSQIDQFAIENDLNILADSAYPGSIYITPSCYYKFLEEKTINDKTQEQKKKIQSSFQQKQAALRTPVERGNSSVKRFGIANTKCKLFPELHAMCIMICFQLCQLEKNFENSKNNNNIQK